MLVDELPVSEALAVERHVAVCGLCQRVLESLTAGDPTDSVTPGPVVEDEIDGDSFANRLGQEALPELPPSTHDGRPPGFALTIVSAMASDPEAPRTSQWPAIPGYVIQAELGRGGMGVVYLASQIKAKRLVASR
jgi:hypothetical protein